MVSQIKEGADGTFSFGANIYTNYMEFVLWVR